MHEHRTSDLEQITRDYLRRGWRVLPIPFRTKAPVLDGWQNLTITEAQVGRYFASERQNIGVLLGQPSSWLIDVDLDHPRAIELAATCLPPTGAIFGRASKRCSHWLYYASQPVSTRQWRLPDKQMVVELRSSGGQTVFPGSVHPSGERVEWYADSEPAVVDPLELETQLERLYQQVVARSQAQLKPRTSVQNIDTQAPPRIVERARRYTAKLPPAISGEGGHVATFRAACTLVVGFGLERDQALELLRDWNETHCQPRWTERELEHKVDDALKQPGWRGYLLTGKSRRVSAPATCDRTYQPPRD